MLWEELPSIDIRESLAEDKFIKQIYKIYKEAMIQAREDKQIRNLPLLEEFQIIALNQNR